MANMQQVDVPPATATKAPLSRLLGDDGDEDDDQDYEVARVSGAKKKKPVVYDAATQKALRKLDEELRVFEYRTHFDMQAALKKNNNNYRQARNYLHWQERAVYDKKVKRAEAEEERRQRALSHRRKLLLAPTLGAPTLRNPVGELVEGKPLRCNDEEVVRRHICRCFAERDLKLDSRHLDALPPFLGTTIALQLGRYKAASACLNKLTTLVNGDTPALCLRQIKNVVTLRLTSNQLQELPSDIGLLQSLRTLALDNNNLCELPPSFTLLKNLTYLNLRQNRMTALPEYLGQLVYLKHLDVAKNLLTEVCHTFGDLTALTYLDMSDNKFQHLAVLPSVRSQLWNNGARNCLLDWTVVVNEATDKPKWFNRVTGNMVESMPSGMRDFLASDQGGDDDGASQPPLAGGSGKKAAAGAAAKGGGPKEAKESQARKRELRDLAKANKREWDTPIDYTTGFMQYFNNITQVAQSIMPPELDKLGWKMAQLRVLKINNNLLRALPDSMAGMTSLESLEVCNNYLKRVPTCIKKWTRLQKLMLTSNDIVNLPDLFGFLPDLTELHLTNNLMQALPDTLGSCSKLCQLRAGNNQLTRLPYTFGYLSGLKELQVFGNPIQDPPMHLITGNREDLLWLLRKKHQESLRGPPPEVSMHRHGVANERLCPVPGFMKELERLLADPPSGPRTFADLRLKGLEALPPPLVNKVGLQVLDLSLNQFAGNSLVFPPNFTSLLELRLWRCQITDIDPSIASLNHLQRLNLDENRLRLLPDAICKLRSLQVLRLTQNLLCVLPRRFGFLNSLVELFLDSNVLETLPPSFSRLVNLRRLSLARNKLFAVDDFMVELKNLEYLDLESNQLTFLPETVGQLRCRSMLLSMNRLEHLDDKFLYPNLCNHLVSLRLAWNNLVELPLNFFECHNLSDFTYECNPLKSPPPELLAESLSAIYKYGKLRKIRLEEIESLLRQHDFEFAAERMCPTTRHLVTGNTGYLTPEDLKDMDEAVDAFVNGKFYNCGFTADEIVGKLSRLRRERNNEFYRVILEAITKIIEQELPNTLYGMGVLVDEVSRPWGRDGEVVYCYGLSLQALLEDRPPFFEGEVYRPALYSKAMEILPPSVFPYDHKALKAAIRSFTHSNGRVSYIEKIQYPACECIDPDTGDFANHLPCELPSLVIVRTIYTEAEAARRKQEEKDMMAALDAVGRRIVAFLDSKVGKDRLKEELRYRRDRFQGAVLARESKIADLKDEQRTIEVNLAVLRKREDAFLKGMPFEYHRISSHDEIEALIREADLDTAHFVQQVRALEEEVRVLEKQKKMTDRELTTAAMENLVQKYAYYESEKLLYMKRREAFRNRWRRPWDGDDGRDFLLWLEHKSHPDINVDWEKVTRLINKVEGTFKYDDDGDEDDEAEEDEEGGEGGGDGGGIEERDFHWEGCEHMEMFNNMYVAMMLAKRGESGFDALMGNAMSRLSSFLNFAKEATASVGSVLARVTRRGRRGAGGGEGDEEGGQMKQGGGGGVGAQEVAAASTAPMPDYDPEGEVAPAGKQERES